MTEYEACKHVLETKLASLKWERDQLREERWDVMEDPEISKAIAWKREHPHEVSSDPAIERDYKIYESVRKELRAARIRYWMLHDLLESLDSDTLDVLQGVWY